MKLFQIITLLFLFSCGTHEEPSKTDEVNTTDSLQINIVRYGGEISFRGLQVNENGDIWASGSKSTVIHSADSGKSWTTINVPEGEYDFRDIEVIEDTIIIMNAGTPCLILRSIDFGEKWDTVYYHADSNAFLDGMDFSENGIGVAFGDPISASIMFLKSTDYGQSWTDHSDALQPKKDLEFGFAASGSGIVLIKNKAYIGTGGDAARIYEINIDRLKTEVIESPMLSGNDSRGIYSMAKGPGTNMVAVGGSWKEEQQTNTIIYSNDRNSWKVSKDGNRYLSSVSYAGNNSFIACGPSGVIISKDLGITWTQVSSRGYNVVQVDTTTGFAMLAGTKGEVGFCKFNLQKNVK